MLKVELIHAAGCKQCTASAAALRKVAEEAARGDLEWREVNVLDELDYAVSLGVLALPAIAVNGKLRFSSLPTADELRALLERRAGSVWRCSTR